MIQIKRNINRKELSNIKHDWIPNKTNGLSKDYALL